MVIEERSVEVKQAFSVEEAERAYPELFGEVKKRKWAQRLLQELGEYDKGTFNHSVEVARVARELAVMDGDIKGRDLEALTLAAVLHDIGKMYLEHGLGKEILNSPRSLSDAERKIMQEHVASGFSEIVTHAKTLGILPDVLARRAAHIMRAHHTFQPEGYPQDVVGKQVPKRMRVLQRYLAIADQAAALASGGESSHAFMVKGKNDAGTVKDRLQKDRNGNPTTFFHGPLVDNTMTVLTTLNMVRV